MIYGQVARRWTALFSFGLWALFTLTALTASPPLDARPAPASELTVTLLSAGDGRLMVQGSDGRAIAVPITPATWALRAGLPAAPRDFAPGETLHVRLGRGKGGAKPALMICDPETAAALDAQRGHPLRGTLLDTTNGKVWIVQPDGGALPLPVCLSARTTFQAGGAAAAVTAFSAGASVTITTRGLPNGLPSAVSVSDAGAAAGDETPTRRGTVSGIVLEVRPDLGVLTLRDKTGTDRTLAVTAGTRVKVRKRPATLADIAAGMHVTAFLRGASDAAGTPTASSLSASDR